MLPERIWWKIWTARGKTFMNKVENTIKYLSLFLELILCQSRKLTSSFQVYPLLALIWLWKCPILLNDLKLASVCHQGKNLFDPGKSHFLVLGHEILWNFFQIHKTTLRLNYGTSPSYLNFSSINFAFKGDRSGMM